MAFLSSNQPGVAGVVTTFSRLENANRSFTQRMGRFSVLEHQQDLTVAPDNAVAGLRRRDEIANSSKSASSFCLRFLRLGSTTSSIAIMFCSTVKPRNTLFSWGK